MASRPTTGAWVLCSLLVLGCDQNLDPAWLVKDLRLLAVQAQPPEILYELVPMPADFTVSALVVDPQGGTLSYSWRFCPVESSNACNDYEAIKGRTDSTHYAVLDDMRAVATSGTAELEADAQGLSADERGSHPVWPYAVPPFSVHLTSRLYRYYLETGYFGGGLGSWPSVVLELQAADGRTLQGQKRVVLGIRDLRGAAAPLAEQYGYDLCPLGQTSDDVPGCILIRERTANTNPVFDKVQIAYGDQANAEFQDVSGQASLQVGKAMRILPIMTAASAEAYQNIRTNLQTRELAVQDFIESISISWFATAGKLQDRRTWPLFTKTLDTVFTAPQEVPEGTGGLVTIWMVARDQRGGTAWTHLDVLVTD